MIIKNCIEKLKSSAVLNSEELVDEQEEALDQLSELCDDIDNARGMIFYKINL